MLKWSEATVKKLNGKKFEKKKHIRNAFEVDSNARFSQAKRLYRVFPPSHEIFCSFDQLAEFFPSFYIFL